MGQAAGLSIADQIRLAQTERRQFRHRLSIGRGETEATLAGIEAHGQTLMRMGATDVIQVIVEADMSAGTDLPHPDACGQVGVHPLQVKQAPFQCPAIGASRIDRRRIDRQRWTSLTACGLSRKVPIVALVTDIQLLLQRFERQQRALIPEQVAMCTMRPFDLRLIIKAASGSRIESTVAASPAPSATCSLPSNCQRWWGTVARAGGRCGEALCRRGCTASGQRL